MRVTDVDDLTDITTLATNAYDLDNRLTARLFGNATTAEWEYDDEDRILAIVHDAIDLAYGRDAEGNPTYCRHNHATTTSELYGYDAADRLTSFARGTLNAGGTAIEGTPAHTQDWTLDKLGNWREFAQPGSGAGGGFHPCGFGMLDFLVSPSRVGTSTSRETASAIRAAELA